ncbi:papain family cysteine protease [Opisthorchis viverrini]|uniref:Cathepsin B-like cysteine proteinase n=2 Tax=Opisthorchis viverrini TaxID=6198 RepID=A0A074ZCD5_OPIVI|nr:hypothetical protein T265_07607 [Opisthorchis viverrini]KER24823.1 hypothetical protein T265_07607 [Opisthorchis viverrini]OON23648.1 papain family cysteine protease [Opisthorchis viverrini]
MPWLILVFGTVLAAAGEVTGSIGMREYVDSETGAKWIYAEPPETFRQGNLQLMFRAIREPEEQRSKRPTVSHESLGDENIPKTFDAREQWPHCPTIGQIRDQSSCGSCWAFGAVEAMSDRLCIHSNGTFTKSLSSIDLVSCCGYCGFGCQGGYPPAAWDFWQAYGIVTGGSKEDPMGCRSYPFPKCSHHGSKKYPPCPHRIYDTPKCVPKCDTPNIDYETDKTRANITYNVQRSQMAIMKEIMINGPVEAAFEVYEDFLGYKQGVYFHSTGEFIGGHAIRILGWGEENGTPYWLIANSWNEGWGEDGYFKMLRGKNECGIEDEVTAGLPELSIIPPK